VLIGAAVSMQQKRTFGAKIVSEHGKNSRSKVNHSKMGTVQVKQNAHGNWMMLFTGDTERTNTREAIASLFFLYISVFGLEEITPESTKVKRQKLFQIREA
jgi:hypothetical protein